MNNKILVVTSLWGRHELTAIVLDYYRQLQRKIGIELLCVVSKDDHRSHEIALGDRSYDIGFEYGWNVVVHDNQPLSQKHNYLFNAARSFNPDLTVLIGSDDLISEGVFHWYDRYVSPKFMNLVGLKDLYFYSIQEDWAFHFPGYPPPSPKTIGAGRCFSRKILETMNYRPWLNERLNRGLDSSSTAQMRRFGIGEASYTMEHVGGIAVDIKDPEVTLTKWNRIQNVSQRIDNKIMEDAFGPQMEAVRKLKKGYSFDPDQDYNVRIIKDSHPLYGQQMRVKGNVAVDLAIKGVVERVDLT